MSVMFRTIALLVISNTFMTFAWYAHLKNMGHRPWLIAALVSWGIALFEYLFQVPANRIGYSVLSLAQLKILQEVITLLVFIPFALFYMRQAWSWNYVWAGLCLMGAVFFMFREPVASAPLPSSEIQSSQATLAIEQEVDGQESSNTTGKGPSWQP